MFYCNAIMKFGRNPAHGILVRLPAGRAINPSVPAAVLLFKPAREAFHGLICGLYAHHPRFIAKFSGLRRFVGSAKRNRQQRQESRDPPEAKPRICYGHYSSWMNDGIQRPMHIPIPFVEPRRKSEAAPGSGDRTED